MLEERGGVLLDRSYLFQLLRRTPSPSSTIPALLPLHHVALLPLMLDNQSTNKNHMYEDFASTELLKGLGEVLYNGNELAHKMGVTHTRSDSQLVTNQIKGDYQTKEPLLAKYLQHILEMTKDFNTFEIVHVMHEENTCVNLLEKLFNTKIYVSTELCYRKLLICRVQKLIMMI